MNRIVLEFIYSGNIKFLITNIILAIISIILILFVELNTTSIIVLILLIIAVSLIAGYNFIGKRISMNDEFKNILIQLRALDLNKIQNFSGINSKLIKSNHIVSELNSCLTKVSEQINKQKRFTEDVSHELKTPLTIMRGELELALLANKTDQDYIVTIASALDEIIRLSKILESLLDLTHAESGELNLEFEKKDITKLLTEIVADAKILATKKSITVLSNIDQPILLYYDSVRMHQALLNLIDNAIKYSDDNDVIGINVYDEADQVVIKISDTGKGIPKDKIDLIFDRFYRIDKHKNKKNGVGLGLSIVNWIIKKHNGSISVNSVVNNGTEFTITLPKEQNNDSNRSIANT